MVYGLYLSIYVTVILPDEADTKGRNVLWKT